MMKPPTTLAEIQALIDNSVAESIHLDYKGSEALVGKTSEIAKDVSAFANSDGGIIIYGVREEGRLPKSIDQGVDHKKRTREWLEQVIQSNVSPIIDDLRIYQIPLNDSNSLYVIQVARSVRAPHQERESKRYYKRYNFKSAPMEDYEINDIRNRATVHPSLVNVDLMIERGVFVELVIENISSVAVSEVSFEFSENLYWEHGCPPQLANGLKYLSAGQKLPFPYTTVVAAFAKESKVLKTFSVTVCYMNTLIQQRVRDTFLLDISNYDRTSIIQSELYHHGKKIEDAIKALASAVDKLSKHVEKLEPLVNPTGLNISMTSLRQIQKVLGSGDIYEDVDPTQCSAQEFMEILHILPKEAFLLEYYFDQKFTGVIPDSIEGVSAETFQKLKHVFKWPRSDH